MASPSPAPAALPSASAASRLPALDWMRGVVMILMTVDHASDHFNAGRLMTDSAFMYKPGTALPAAQFFTRWLSHLCAPTFVFLAGAALALSIEKRRARGEPARSLDRFIVTRGLILAALDPIWMSWALARPGVILLQVLYAIGLSLICMAALRRLSTAWMVGISLVLIGGGEALVGLALWASGGAPTIPWGLVLTGGIFRPLIVGYPFVHWLAIMMLGWAFGRSILAGAERVAQRLALAGAGALALFAILRGLNGYGNMALLREDSSVVQWLHVSKYPPSVTYSALELGLMALFLAGFFVLAQRSADAPWAKPLLVLGQTALFFYVLHVHLLLLAAYLLGMHQSGGLAAAWIAAAGAVVALYPLCVAYRRYKQAHPDGWARYL